MAKSVYLKDYDVLVAGGGVSGCAAAIAAGRAGASVLVIEQSGYLGGTLTGCGVGPMMTYHAGEKQVIRGIMQELVAILVERGMSPGHVPDTKQYTSTVTPFDAEGLKLVLDELVAQAGCTVLFHTFVGAAQAQDGHIKSVTLCNKDGINTASGKIFIDATGDGDVATWAGAPMTKGRPEDGAAQPMTMNLKYCGVDTRRLKDHVLAHLEDFPHMAAHKELFAQDIPIDLEGFEVEFKREKAAGRLSIARENILVFATGRPGEYIFNTTRVIGHDATDAASLSDAEILGRRQCAQLARFLKDYVPGFENALVEYSGPSIGVRSSRQLSGTYLLTAQDILTRKEFPSVIAHAGYPIDIHNPSGEGTQSTFMSEPGSYYSIPYEIMTCPGFSNLLVSGRCVSASFEAQAAIRVTPSAGSIGQAAGAAAAIAARGNEDVRTLDIKALQVLLKSQGAYIEA